MANENEMNYCIANIEGKTVFLQEVVWTYCNGLIPDNCLVNHKDGNTQNNNSDNLELVEENTEYGDLHKMQDRIFHKSTYNENFVKKHFHDVYEKIQSHDKN